MYCNSLVLMSVGLLWKLICVTLVGLDTGEVFAWGSNQENSLGICKNESIVYGPTSMNTFVGIPIVYISYGLLFGVALTGL